MTHLHIPHISEMTIRQEGPNVLLICNGRLIANMPYQAAMNLAKAITIQARKAEVQANAEQIAHDQAILLRSGAPVGLTNRPDIQREAGKLAAWDSDLRRYMPGGVKSQEHVGTPGVLDHQEYLKRKETNGND